MKRRLSVAFGLEPSPDETKRKDSADGLEWILDEFQYKDNNPELEHLMRRRSTIDMLMGPDYEVSSTESLNSSDIHL